MNQRSLLRWSLIVAVVLLPGIALFPSDASAAVAGSESLLTLQEAERLALEGSLKLQSSQLSTAASEVLIRRGFSVYDPRLQLAWREGTERDISNYQFFVGPTGVDIRQIDLAFSQKLFTGGDLALSLTNQRQSLFTDPEPAINPEYRSELTLSLVQPLLKDFGRTTTEQELIFATYDRDMSVQQLRLQALGVVAEVRNAWFDILHYRDQLATREVSVALAEKILSENRARQDAGILAPIEVLEAEVGLQVRRRERLDSQRALQDALDRLALVLNLRSELQVAPGQLSAPELAPSEAEALAMAERKRPELLEVRQGMAKLSVQQQIDSNRLLPRLDLNAGISRKGIGEGYNEVLDQLPEDDIQSWHVGLTLEVPLGNRAAKNDLLRTRLELQRLQTDLRALSDQIRQEIRAAIRQIEVSRAKVEVSRDAYRLSEEKLRILLKRKEVGLSTTREVLEGEEDLARARTDEIAALADLNGAVTDYLSATGELLEHERIRFAGVSESAPASPAFVQDQP